MSRIDIHPDSLVDRELDGTLSEEDRAKLERHRASCPACAMEGLLLQDFAEEVEPAAEDAEVLARIVDRLVPLEPGARPRRRRPVARVALVAAAVLLFAGAALGLWAGAETLLADRREGATEEEEPAPADEGRGARVDGTESERPAGPEAPAETTEVVDPAPTPAPRAPGRAGRGAEGPSAAELFAEANAARRRGAHREAARLYRELRRRHPGSREEVASRVSLGRLELDRLGDARGALREFDAYLATSPSGTLAQEARLGRALALERLGRRAQAAAAWRELLERHPGSIHAPRAERRLEALGETGAR